MTHPYKHVLQAMIDGHTVQWQDDDGKWFDLAYNVVLSGLTNEAYHPDRYRVKPRTITIGTFEVPEPVRESLKKGQPYFLSDCTASELASPQFWDGMPCELMWLERGLIHLDGDAAHLHAEARMSFTKKG